MQRSSILLKAIRPKTLLLGVCPIVLGNILSYTYLKSSNQLSPNFYLHFILTLITVLLMQSAANLVNDLKDFEKGIDNEERSGPERMINSGKISPSEIKFFYRLFFTISFAICFYFTLISGWQFLAIGVICISAAYFYTGGPRPLAYYALGELTAFIFFGPIAVLTCYFQQTAQFDLRVLLISFTTGLLAASVMAINNFRDRETDSNSGKITLATLISKIKILRFTQFLSLVPIFIMLVTGIANEKLGLAIFFSSLSFVMWSKAIPKKNDSHICLNQSLAKTSKYSFIFTLLFSLLLIL